jgi:hypothetical protein
MKRRGTHFARYRAEKLAGGRRVSTPGRTVTARLERTFRALGLPPSRERPVGFAGPIASLGARAMRLACPRALTEREDRALSTAEALAHDPTRALAVLEHAYAYLALASCSWAKNAGFERHERDAALIGAIGFASLIGSNVRSALGVEDRLQLLAIDPSLDADVRASIVFLASSHHAWELLDTLAGPFERLRRSVERSRTKRAARRPRPRSRRGSRA